MHWEVRRLKHWPDRTAGRRIPLPPLLEQRTIARYLDHADLRIQRHISATRRQIALLREYRTRLIADVVTGKLDVRQAKSLRANGDDETVSEHPK